MTTQNGHAAPTSAPDAVAAACNFLPLVVRATNRVTGATQSSVIDRPFAFFGRVKGVGVHLDDPSVSQCHAYLQVVGGVPYCFDLGSRTGVLWDDGGRGRGPVPLGQTLRLGVFDVQIDDRGGEVAAPAGDGAAPAPEISRERPPVVLEVRSPNEPFGHFSLDQPITLLGRHPNCDLRLVDQAVAYFQCALVVASDQLWCVDLLTRNGTVVNGRATRLSRLRDGDLLEIGPVVILVHTEDPARRPLVLNRSEPRTGSAVGANGAEAVAAALAPMREMMDHFQQCFVAMARMFTTMQQEHTAMMCEQMRQIQELIRDSSGRGLSAPAPSGPPDGAPGPAAPAPPEPKIPIPKSTTHGPEAEALAAAHTWFIDRMTKMAAASKRD